MIEEAVQQILQGQNGLSYEIQGKKIIIKKVQSGTATPVKKIKATGKVVDGTGEPVIGATVKEYGTPNGAITDIDGNFSLNVAENASLEVSYIGYQSQRVKAEDGKMLAVTLQEDTEMLDEVVVVGYGTVKKANVVGSIAKINSFQTILEEYLNSYKKEDTITDATKELIKQFYDEQNILDTMEKSVNILVNTIKEIYKKKTYQHPNTTIKDLLISYINRDTTLYNEQSKTLNIDLNEDILEHIKQRDKEERTESPWHYYELYSWFKGVLLQDLKNNQISYYKSCNSTPLNHEYSS